MQFYNQSLCWWPLSVLLLHDTQQDAENKRLQDGFNLGHRIKELLLPKICYGSSVLSLWCPRDVGHVSETHFVELIIQIILVRRCEEPFVSVTQRGRTVINLVWDMKPDSVKRFYTRTSPLLNRSASHCVETFGNTFLYRRKGFKRKIYYYHYVISGYHRNELSSVDVLRESELYNRSRTSEKFFASVYRVCSVPTDNSLMSMVGENCIMRSFITCTLHKYN
jgi:hypothetical protein